MDGSLSTLYVLAPDANAATLKRLRGLGIASGIVVVAVSHISNLPATQNENSILIIPESTVDSSFPLTAWPNLFLVTRNKSSLTFKTSNSIHINCASDAAIDWVRITSAAIRYVIKGHDKSSWHALRQNILSKTFCPSADFAKWTARHRPLSTAKFNRITRALESLEKIYGPQGECITSVEINLDPQRVQIELKFKPTKPIDPEQITRHLDAIDFCEHSTINFGDEITVFSVFNIVRASSLRISFNMIKPLTTHEHERSKKAAS